MTQEEKNNYLLRFRRFQQSRERLYAPKINKALKGQYADFVKHYDRYGMSAVDHIDRSELQGVLKTLYIDAGTTYGLKVRGDLNREKGRMPIGFSERMLELITEYFQTYIFNGVERITEETQRLIREVFTNAYEQGLGIDDIIIQFENTELSKVRSRLIARTETVTAANRGAQFVAKDTGLKLNKEWLSASDNRVRRDHQLVNGQTVPMDELFTVGKDKMLVPGDRGNVEGRPKTSAANIVNCRCTTLYLPIRENGKLVRV